MNNSINNVSFMAQPVHSAKKEKKNNLLPTLAVDLGIGGVAGGLIGLTSKPWQQEGVLTDKFVYTVLDATAEKDVLNISKEAGLLKSLLKLDIKKGMPKEELIKIVEDNVDALGFEHLEKAELHAQLERELSESGAVDDMINFFIDIKNETKEEIAKNFDDIKTGKLKALKDNADESTKEAYNILKDTIKKMKTSAALKWAGIGAATMAISGLIIGLISNRSKAKSSSIKTYRS